MCSLSERCHYHIKNDNVMVIKTLYLKPYTDSIYKNLSIDVWDLKFV